MKIILKGSEDFMDHILLNYPASYMKEQLTQHRKNQYEGRNNIHISGVYSFDLYWTSTGTIIAEETKR